MKKSLRSNLEIDEEFVHALVEVADRASVILIWDRSKAETLLPGLRVALERLETARTIAGVAL